MAGDWIPATTELPRKREVLLLSAKTGRSRHEVVGLLLEFWIWVSNESSDGRVVGVHVDALAPLIGADTEFWRAVIDVGWLVDDPSGLIVPRSDEWITRAAKARLQKTKRQKEWRANRGNVDGRVDGRASTSPSTTEQNRTDTDPPNGGSVAKPRKRFVKPTVEEVAAYCRERKNGIDPQRFIDHYESNGWRVGRNQTPMKDWQASIRTWEKNGVQNGNGGFFSGGAAFLADGQG